MQLVPGAVWIPLHSAMNVDITGLACGTNTVVEPLSTPKRKTPSRNYTGGCIQVMLHHPADQSNQLRGQLEAQNMPWYGPASRADYDWTFGI